MLFLSPPQAENTPGYCSFSGVGMKLTDVGIATTKKGWVFFAVDAQRCGVQDDAFMVTLAADTKASKETAPPPLSTSLRCCTSATSSARSWASSLCSPNLKSPDPPWNPNPHPRLHPRRRHSGPQWRESHNRRSGPEDCFSPSQVEHLRWAFSVMFLISSFSFFDFFFFKTVTNLTDTWTRRREHWVCPPYSTVKSYRFLYWCNAISLFLFFFFYFYLIKW